MKGREKNGQGVINQENKIRKLIRRQTFVALKKENGQKPIQGTGAASGRNSGWLIKRGKQREGVW